MRQFVDCGAPIGSDNEQLNFVTTSHFLTGTSSQTVEGNCKKFEKKLMSMIQCIVEISKVKQNHMCLDLKVVSVTL